MGKHERQEVENAEKTVVNYLNNKKISEVQKKNKWINHCTNLVATIKKDFDSVEKAKHIGNIYGKGEIGDIKILPEGNPDWIYIELKMSESPLSKGTLANISQNALTNSNLFLDNNLLSWSNFRKKKRFTQKIISELNKYRNYPLGLNIGVTNTQIKKKAAHLKEKFQKFLGLSSKISISDKVCKYTQRQGINEIANICCNIVNMARKDKIDYLTYLNQLEQNEENVKKFTIAMLIGYHTKKQLNHILGIPFHDIFEILNSYYVYYTNEKQEEITVTMDDLGKEVLEIIQSKVKIIFPKEQTNCIITANGKALIRIVFHWKNKFQGIETPCLNIFKEY